jgi:Flp pilus assembly pilin Flp
VLRRKPASATSARRRRSGSVFVEYILLVTIVGIGIIVGLACLREALVNELLELAAAINAIDC